MKNFSIVVAMDENSGIGKDGDLAWRLPPDLKHFKEITTKVSDPAKRNAVIMGRKTWDSLPAKFKPLPDRFNAVLTQMSIQAFCEIPSYSGATPYSSLDKALLEIRSMPDIDKIFVIGGGQIFTEAIKHEACKTLYITHLKGDFNCDAFFPAIPLSFKRIEESAWEKEGVIDYHFCQYQRL